MNFFSIIDYNKYFDYKINCFKIMIDYQFFSARLLKYTVFKARNVKLLFYDWTLACIKKFLLSTFTFRDKFVKVNKLNFSFFADFCSALRWCYFLGRG